MGISCTIHRNQTPEIKRQAALQSHRWQRAAPPLPDWEHSQCHGTYLCAQELLEGNYCYMGKWLLMDSKELGKTVVLISL